MPKFSIFAIIIVILYFLYLIRPVSPDTANISIKDNIYTLEIAKSLVQKSKGLAKRSALNLNCGMIFIYPQEGFYPFWMKDTLIPLDIIWLNSRGEVVDIKTGKPHDLTPLTNQSPAQYIIELNPNTSNLKIGDTIIIPNI